MTLPGPSGIPWAGELLLFAGLALGLGELVRLQLRDRVPFVRDLDLIERGLLDVYLGGAALYLLAALPIGAFDPIGVAGMVALLVAAAIVRRRQHPMLPRIRELAERALETLRRPAYFVTLGAVLALFAIEVWVATSEATGNTYDASLFALYSSLLLQSHTIPLTLAPVTSIAVAYPQGTTVWFSAAQGLFGLPPARTSLLVTPLFLAMAPLGAFALGHRLAGGVRAGAAFALVFALLGPFTRGLVGGSNDFVLAFPLVLLLASRATLWTAEHPPGWPDALAFGGLAGYAAALNPVGVQWLFVTLPLFALLGSRAVGGNPIRWAARWAGAVGVGLLFLLPSVAVLLAGHASPSLTPGAAPPLPGTPIGVGSAQFVGGIDPFLFRTQDTWLSPFPFLRAELAVLLVVGALLLVAGVAWRDRRPDRPFGRFALAGGIVATAMIGAFALARQGVGGFTTLVFLSNATEASILLFSLFTAVAAIPLVALLDRVDEPPVPPPPSRRRFPMARARSLAFTGAGALLLTALLLVPGATLTAGSLPGQLDGLYDQFSQVSGADFDLLAWAGGHLSMGDRVLVAPGSIAEFLPAYRAGLTILYPMVPNFQSVNSSYALVVQLLTNGTLGTPGLRALAVLDASIVVVTENNTVLFPAFSPVPMVDSPSYCEWFHEADAYVFATAPVAGGSCGSGL